MKRRLIQFISILALATALLSPVSGLNPATPAHAATFGLDDGLVGYWPFDQFNGTTSPDDSGYNNTATLHSAMALTANAAPTDIANPAALASVNNANSYATAPGTNIDTLQKFTLAFWVRINKAAPFPAMTLISLNNGKASFGYYDSGNLYFDINVNGLPRRLFKLDSNVADGGWHHLAGSFDGATIHFYYDGQPYSQLDAAGPLPTGQGVTLSDPTNPLNGALDDVRVYNRVLSAGEVSALTYNCASVQGIPASECRALVNLSVSTNAWQWTNHSGWLTNNAPCTWAGLLCQNGHIIFVVLPNNNLVGTLPPDIANLTQLINLGLPNNHLTGDIPFELGQLSQLVNLDLSGNLLSGGVPFTLGNLTQLQTLSLHNNQLRGLIPTQLSNLNQKLVALNLGFNSLSALDASQTAFLNSKQADWAATQTLPPGNVHVSATLTNGLILAWTPISYTADIGYYDVLSSTPATGIYQSVGKTISKSTASMTVINLTPGQAYSFVVRTFTAKHGAQQNDLLSDATDPFPVTFTPAASNRPPLAVNDSYTTTANVALTADVAHGLLANDSDPDGNPITAFTTTNPSHGSLNLLANGSFSYTPVAGFSGIDTFTYQANDGQASSTIATATITVNAPIAIGAVPIRVTIALNSQPGSATNFNFDGSFGAFTLDDIAPQDGDSFTNARSFPVRPGIYTITAQTPNTWFFGNISCNPVNNTVADLTLNQIVIDASNASGGSNITCTFLAQRTGQIVAGKYNDRNHNHTRDANEPWLNGWQMTLHGNMSPPEIVRATGTDGAGRTIFGNLRPGSYTLCEKSVIGWFNITPNTTNSIFNAPCYDIALDFGKSVWGRFGNSTTPLVTSLNAQADFTDISISAMPATDDLGNTIWDEDDFVWPGDVESSVLYLPSLSR